MELTGRRGILVGLAMALALGLASPASAQSYLFTKVADSAEDNFDPFSFGCATINAGGAIAFKVGSSRSGRLQHDPWDLPRQRGRESHHHRRGPEAVRHHRVQSIHERSR
jgi:hypothetical protein